MSYILTLVASSPDNPVSATHLEEVQDLCREHDIRYTCAPVWLAEKTAVDLGLSDRLPATLTTRLREHFASDRIDFFLTAIENRQKRLLLADMDSTIVTGETLDELADYAGLKEHIAAITTRAMNGELDFEEALRKRVELLKGLPVAKLEETLLQTRLSPGAETFVKTMAKNGAKCILVSGGFTFFTGAIANKAGFHEHHGNVLSIDNGMLDGKVVDPILDKRAKLNFLREYTRTSGLNPAQTLTIGDGANDLPMLEAAGLGIGYRPKEIVQNAIPNCILYGDLTAALYAQGYRQEEFSA